MARAKFRDANITKKKDYPAATNERVYAGLGGKSKTGGMTRWVLVAMIATLVRWYNARSAA